MNASGDVTIGGAIAPRGLELEHLPGAFALWNRRSTATMSFDLRRRNDYIPIGLGVGKIWSSLVRRDALEDRVPGSGGGNAAEQGNVAPGAARAPTTRQDLQPREVVTARGQVRLTREAC